MFDAFDDELDFTDDQFNVCPTPKSCKGMSSNIDGDIQSTIVGNQLFRDTQIKSQPTLSRSATNIDDSGFDECNESSATSDFYFQSKLQTVFEDQLEDSRHDAAFSIALPQRKRLFPGPAGAIQQLNSGFHPLLKRGRWSTPAESAGTSQENSFVCTQFPNNDCFKCEPWLSMCRDLIDGEKLEGSCTNRDEILEKNDIGFLLRKASRNRLPDGKVPSLLCVRLQKISYRYTGKYARSLFKDPTGEIQGWIDRFFVKEYESKLKPGCVLVLKKPSVLSLNRKCHYLAIHSSNVLDIYLVNDDGHVIRIQPASDSERTPPFFRNHDQTDRQIEPEITKSTGNFQLEDDPLWDSDDFDSLMLQMNQ